MRETSFTYRAIRADGTTELGSVVAPSREEAAEDIIRRGLFPVEISQERAARWRQAKASSSDIALGLRVLATLLESGLPVTRALQALDELVPATWRSVLPRVGEAVSEGQSLAAALEGASLEIPPLVIGMIRAGEAGSGLALAVRRAADYMESTAATQRAIRSALAYPLLLAVAGAVSLSLLVGIVLPRFEAILADLGQALPPATRIVISAADILRAAALPMFISFVVIGLVGHAWVSTDTGQVQWHRILLTLPVVGLVRRSAASARISAALSALLESGVPLVPALQHAARAGGDAALSQEIEAARIAVLEGSSLARALQAESALTPTVIRLIRAGEEAGKVGPMLAHAAKLEGERAEQVVRSAVRLIEPALIIGFGSLVALVAAALLQAVYAVRPGA